MRLTHVNITMPQGGEAAARTFYGELLGLPETPRPKAFRSHSGLWYDIGGLDIHLSIKQMPSEPDAYRHFGIEVEDVDALRAKMDAAGVITETGEPAPWKRFYMRDPFGNRIEIHQAGVLRE